MLNFAWWRDKDNREGARSIVDILKVVVPALCIAGAAIWGLLEVTSDDPAPGSGTTVTGTAITTGDDANINIGGTQEVNTQ